MNLPPPPQDDDPIITQFRPVEGQWELNDENINRIDPRTGQTILRNYCQHINTTPIEVYQYLIETKGCDVNLQDKNQDTPLIYALCNFECGDVTVFMYLLTQKTVNVNIRCQFGYTLLHIACQKINDLPLEIFKLLIETHGADVNVQDNNNHTPLHHAVCSFNRNNRGDLTVLTYLLSREDVIVTIKSNSGSTLLHAVCLNIDRLPLDIFKVLIETHCADVNVQNNNKDTPIHLALLNFNPRNRCDITVLTYLLTQKTVNIHIKNNSGSTLLHIACQRINDLPLGIFKLLIETLGCDVNVQNNLKITSLHYSINSFNPNWGGNIEVLTYLLTQKDINVNIKSNSGYTLLHYACERINKLPIDVFKVLIETHGGDVNVQDNKKDTPIHEALRTFNPNDGGDITVLTYLINQKNVNVKGQYGNTILHRACMNINKLPLDIFKALIETQGCDVNVQSDYNNTPLHHSICYFDPNDGNNIAVLHYLLTQKSVNFGIKGKKGHNLLHYACVSNLSGSRDSAELNAKVDSNLCQIVEMIVERCVEQVLDELTL
jgi:ankyrin repeat protein